MVRQTKVWCDLCSKEQHLQNIVASFQWVEWSSFGKKNAVPTPRQEEYCKDCTEKIKSAIAKVKGEWQKEQKETTAGK